jgi:hypothetical protein
LNPKEHEEL